MLQKNIKLNPNPIIECVAEIVFDRNVDILPSAVFGKVYSELKQKFEDVENLPLYQLPEDIRLSDENLKNKPWHKFSNKDFDILVGATVLAIVVKEPYQRWDIVKEQINFVFSVFQKVNITNSITRIGLKYIDKFKIPLINNINLKIASEIGVNETNELQLRTILPKKDELIAKIGIMNNVTITYKGNKESEVSLLDIDIYKNFEEKDSCDFEKAKEIFEKAHLYQKELFSKLITKEYLQKNNIKVENE